MFLIHLQLIGERMVVHQGAALFKPSEVSKAPRRSLISLQGSPQVEGKLPCPAVAVGGCGDAARTPQTPKGSDSWSTQSFLSQVRAAVPHSSRSPPLEGAGRCGPLTDKEDGIRGGHSLGKSWDRRRPRGVLACVPATSGSACRNSGA